MSEEKKAIDTLKEVASDDFDTLGDDISPKMAQNILNVISNQQKEIEEKSTIIMAGAKKVKQLEKEIEELKKPKYLVHFENNKITKMELINDYISKDKIKEKIDKYRKKIEKLHSQELWNEPEDSIKDFKYNHYLEAYKELLGE